MRTRLLTSTGLVTSTGLGLALVALAPLLAVAEIASLAVLDGPAPLGGYTYAKFESIDVSDNPARTVAVLATVTSATGAPKRLACIFALSRSGPGTVVSCAGHALPGGGSLSRLSHMSMSASGTIVWEARVSGGPDGIFTDDLKTVARAGDPFPGGGFINHPSYPVATNTQGVVFKPYLRQVAEEFDEALARCVGGDGNCSSGGTGTLEVLALKSDPIPDRPGRRLCDFREFDASDFGIVFVADTKTDCEGPGSPKVGVFRKAFGGNLVTLAIEGETSATGTVLGGLDDRPWIGDDGFAAFRSDTQVPELFLCDPAACPNSPPIAAVVKGSLDDVGNALGGFGEPIVGAAGEFVFTAKYPGGCGIFVRRPDGTIEAVQRKGDTIQGGSGALQCGLLPYISPEGKVSFIRNVKPLPKGKQYQAVFLDE